MILVQAYPRQAVVAAIPWRIRIRQGRRLDAFHAANPARQWRIAEIVGPQPTALLPKCLKMGVQAKAQCGGGGIGRDRERKGCNEHVVSLATGLGLA
ncbi:hypothetical protein GCM10010872_38670 [Dyella flava]|nr:hypothetical protein GCM10010872_38670 [Dyella flava]